MANKYYNAVEDREKLEKENKHNIEWMMVMSERSTGKTYSPLADAFERWYKTGGEYQAAYIRRWDSDFDGKNSAKEVYSSLLMNGDRINFIEKTSKGEYNTVEYRAGCYYAGRYDDSTGRTTWNRRQPIAWGFSLNLWTRYKGSSYPYIGTIIIDEFLDPRAAYLREEFSAINNMISTIVRDRTDAHVYMMANTTSLLGYPAWEDFGLQDEILILKKGDSRVYTFKDDEGRVTHLALVWLDASGLKRNKSTAGSSYFAFNSSSTNMIKNGDMELPGYPHLPEEVELKPMDTVYEFFVEFRKQILHAELIDIDGQRFTFIHKKTTPIQKINEDCVYTDSLEKSYKPNYSYGFCQKSNKLHNRIREWLFTNPIYFESNMSGYIFYTYNSQTQDITGKK